MHHLKVSILIAAICLGIVGCRSSASGVYVAAQERQVTMVQLVEAKDGKLTGRLESEGFRDDGALSTKAGGLEGEADGSQLVLRPQGLLGVPGPSLTGVRRGDLLELHLGDQAMRLKRSSMDGFEKERGKLRGRASVVMAKRETDQAVATLATTQKQIQAIEQATDEIIARLEKVPAAYAALASGAETRKRVAAALNAKGQGVAAIQAEVQAQAVLTQMEALHINVEQGANNLEGRIASIGAPLIKLRQACERREASMQDPQFQQACGQAVQQGQRLKKVVERLGPSVRKAKEAYSRTKAGA